MILREDDAASHFRRQIKCHSYGIKCIKSRCILCPEACIYFYRFSDIRLLLSLDCYINWNGIRNILIVIVSIRYIMKVCHPTQLKRRKKQIIAVDASLRTLDFQKCGIYVIYFSICPFIHLLIYLKDVPGPLRSILQLVSRNKLLRTSAAEPFNQHTLRKSRQVLCSWGVDKA